MSSELIPVPTTVAPRLNLKVVHAHATKRIRLAVLQEIRRQLDFHVAHEWRLVGKRLPTGHIIDVGDRAMRKYSDGDESQDVEVVLAKNPDLEAHVADVLFEAAKAELSLVPDGACYEIRITQEAQLIDVCVKSHKTDTHLAKGE